MTNFAENCVEKKEFYVKAENLLTEKHKIKKSNYERSGPKIGIRKVKSYYKRKMEDYGECLQIKDIQFITGYGRKSIEKWIENGCITGTRVKGRFLFLKSNVYNFLISRNYYMFLQKSPEHLRDIDALTTDKEERKNRD
ncbi:MAG: hypothetical protein IK057_02165 [Clostridia bacterium]|nr:hypothetical protein [Clostridia bacterium]